MQNKLYFHNRLVVNALAKKYTIQFLVSPEKFDQADLRFVQNYQFSWGTTQRWKIGVALEYLDALKFGRATCTCLFAFFTSNLDHCSNYLGQRNQTSVYGSLSSLVLVCLMFCFKKIGRVVMFWRVFLVVQFLFAKLFHVLNLNTKGFVSLPMPHCI